MAAEPQRFANLFANPSLEEMHALSPRDFERFVAYVLRRAGYEVKEVGPHFVHGVDLEMRLPGKTRIVGGVECKKHAASNLVPVSVVNKVRGAPAVGRPGAKPFVITTGDFTDKAYQVAKPQGVKPVYLLNGTCLTRYITYIQSSRRDDDDETGAPLSPEYFAAPDLLPAPGKTIILTIANNKGGVGKTTTAQYLGGELARQGKRVVLIDLDAQANLTDACFPEQSAEHDRVEQVPNVAQYFFGAASLESLIIPTGKDRLSIIASDPFLRLRELGGSGRPDIELQFAKDVRDLCTRQIASLGGMPEWIIIDTPPAMSVFTRSALAAATHVLAPARPRKRTVPGTRNMLETLRTMNALTGRSAAFLGILVTHWDGLQISKDFLNAQLPQMLAEFGGHEFETKVPLDSLLERVDPGASTVGAKAYTALAKEVVGRVNERTIDGNSHRTSQNVKAVIRN